MTEKAAVGLEAKYINPFLTSTTNVFKTMVALDLEMGKPSINAAPAMAGENAIAVIGLAGKVKGTVSLILSKEIALKIASNFLGIDIPELNDDVKDAIGELTNMIVGGAKKFFAEMNESFKIAIPTVLAGSIDDIHHKDSIPSLFLPFKTAAGDFYVQVCLIKDPSAD